MSKIELHKGDCLYGVLSVNEKIGTEVLGLKTELKLSWCNGQIGAMPVFKDYEKALDYVDGNKARVFKLELLS